VNSFSRLSVRLWDYLGTINLKGGRELVSGLRFFVVTFLSLPSTNLSELFLKFSVVLVCELLRSLKCKIHQLYLSCSVL